MGTNHVVFYQVVSMHLFFFISYRKRNENIVMNMKMMAIHTVNTKRKRNAKNNHPVISKNNPIQCKCIILIILIINKLCDLGFITPPFIISSIKSWVCLYITVFLQGMLLSAIVSLSKGLLFFIGCGIS